MAAQGGVLKVGQITVAIDGTKVLANASKHAAVSYGQAALRRAKVEIEALADARFQAESAQYEAKMADRQVAVDSGKKPRGREPKAPSAAPEAKDQVNFTDKESRIMKTKDGFQKCYNAQAGVDTESHLIVGQRVSQSPNDKQELAEDLKAVKENASPAIVLVDSSF